MSGVKRDYKSERRYIAAQGPRKNTLADFIKMIWQENIECIIMFTNLVENGKNKCAKYWPDKEKSVNIGKCTLSHLEETAYAFYTVRMFSFQKKDSHDIRIITQFHYTAWPDHSTPEEIGLVQFQRTVTKRYESGAPLLVHCSAGVGRTGTFIALDSLLEQGKEMGRINVFEFVKQMREDRMSMVQTLEQYVFLHKALLCGFQERDTILSEYDLSTKASFLLNDTAPLNQQHLYKDFKFLETIIPVYEDEYKEEALKTENRSKNGDMDILPVSEYRPFLASFVKGRNGYINAVIFPSYTAAAGLIMTQSPLPDTEVDLWRLCVDHQVGAIVVLNDIDEDNNWLPARGENRSCPPYLITARKTGTNIGGVSQSSLLILRDGETQNITAFQVCSRNDDGVIKLAEMVLEKEKEFKLTSVVISKDGAGAAGVFCVLHNALQQLRMDGEVDIFTIVRQLHTRRPEAIANLEEYRKCYQLVSRSVSMNETYANV
ncbi:receptor-type tyrosine-protein phosphatase mu-like [Saccostrea echinata]|uniref:receptor-type tyrosine-protein phosphatase mu-like n=1 Tax=Saccostrea echinata TaxID=191078 RepID=UPI002A7EFCEF|nr:receptor-type tyrosine-protein phosphatase mu-like [Saccostrea echinata]